MEAKFKCPKFGCNYPDCDRLMKVRDRITMDAYGNELYSALCEKTGELITDIRKDDLILPPVESAKVKTGNDIIQGCAETLANIVQTVQSKYKDRYLALDPERAPMITAIYPLTEEYVKSSAKDNNWHIIAKSRTAFREWLSQFEIIFKPLSTLIDALKKEFSNEPLCSDLERKATILLERISYEGVPDYIGKRKGFDRKSIQEIFDEFTSALCKVSDFIRQYDDPFDEDYERDDADYSEPQATDDEIIAMGGDQQVVDYLNTHDIALWRNVYMWYLTTRKKYIEHGGTVPLKREDELVPFLLSHPRQYTPDIDSQPEDEQLFQAERLDSYKQKFICDFITTMDKYLLEKAKRDKEEAYRQELLEEGRRQGAEAALNGKLRSNKKAADDLTPAMLESMLTKMRDHIEGHAEEQTEIIKKSRRPRKTGSKTKRELALIKSRKIRHEQQSVFDSYFNENKHKLKNGVTIQDLVRDCWIQNQATWDTYAKQKIPGALSRARGTKKTIGYENFDQLYGYVMNCGKYNKFKAPKKAIYKR